LLFSSTASLTSGEDLDPNDYKAIHHFKNSKWIWEVSFRYTKDGFSSGVWPTMDFMVTMDGMLIEPVIADWKRK
jgi:hypothetical protein